MTRRASSRRHAVRHSSTESGQGLVELALVAPILILLIMAIFQFAYVLQTQMGLANAVREAARRTAAATDATVPWVRQQLCGANPLACDAGLFADNVQGFDETEFSLSIVFCEYPVNSVVNYRIAISVTYLNPVFFPLLAFATDMMDGVGDGKWELSESAQMRLEYDPTSPPGVAC